jgi:hypothetical protein
VLCTSLPAFTPKRLPACRGAQCVRCATCLCVALVHWSYTNALRMCAAPWFGCELHCGTACLLPCDWAPAASCCFSTKVFSQGLQCVWIWYNMCKCCCMACYDVDWPWWSRIAIQGLSGGVATAEALQQQCAACESQMFPSSMSVFAGWLHVHLSNNTQQVVELRYQQLTLRLHHCLYLDISSLSAPCVLLASQSFVWCCRLCTVCTQCLRR